MLVGILICFYALMSTETVTRGGGTLGNTSFFSAYLLFNVFFAIILFFIKSGLWRVFCGGALAIFLYALFFNVEPTRGAIAALAISIVILAFGYLMFYLFSLGKKRLKIYGFLIVFLLILATLLFLQFDFVKTKVATIWHSGSVQSRIVVWNMALNGWQERPWLGWGQDNFNVPFAKYFDPALPLTQDIWYDRVHNIVLDTAIEGGILGLTSYLAIFAISILYLVRIFPKISDRKNIILPLGMIAALLAYFAQNIWVFDMISSYMMFFLSLAFINFLISPQAEDPQTIPPEKNRSLYSFAGAILIIAAVLTFYFGNIRVAQASKFTVRGLAFPLEQSLPAFQKALAISPISQFETVEQLSTRIIALASQQGQNNELLNQGLKLAEDELKNSIAKNPLDFRLQLFLGKYYNNLFQISSDKEKLNLAEEWLKKATELSPKNQQVYWSLGQTRLFQGEPEEAAVFMQKAVDLEPRFGHSHWYLALTYRIAGKYELAIKEVEAAEKLGYQWQSNVNDIKQVIEIYKGLGNTDALLPLYERGVQVAPEDADLWANLADIYAVYGEREKAKEAAEKVLKLKPELAPQIEEFLKELGY